MNDPLEVVTRERDSALARVRELEAALRDVMSWGIVINDDRLGYLEVQVDRVAVDDAIAVLAKAKGIGK